MHSRRVAQGKLPGTKILLFGTLPLPTFDSLKSQHRASHSRGTAPNMAFTPHPWYPSHVLVCVTAVYSCIPVTASPGDASPGILSFHLRRGETSLREGRQLPSALPPAAGTKPLSGDKIGSGKPEGNACKGSQGCSGSHAAPAPAVPASPQPSLTPGPAPTCPSPAFSLPLSLQRGSYACARFPSF